MSTALMNVGITGSVSICEDVNIYWKRQIENAEAGSLTDPVDAVSTELHVSLPSYTGVQPGDAVLLDSEEMTVQTVVNPHDTITYSTVTVTRGPAQTTPNGATQFPLAAPTAHAAGVIVKVLAYSSPWALIAERFLRPGILAILTELGPDSVTLSAAATGSVTVNS